jgi:two-component system, NarL family, response regulator LiaR
MAAPGEGPPPDDAPVSVLIADPDPLARRALVEGLQGAGGFSIVAEAADGAQAVGLAREHRPDIALLEVAPPQLDALDATRRIAAEAPQVRVVIFSRTYEEGLMPGALRAGAVGYLSKAIGLASLAAALHGVMRGEAAVSRLATMRLIEWLRQARADNVGLRPVRSALTEREWEVLDLMSAGARPSEIAEQLVVSEETVASHAKNLRRKLGVRSRAQLVAAAERLREGPQ